MAEIAAIIVPAVAIVAAPVVQLLSEKYKARNDSLSLADLHVLLNHESKELLALRRDKDNVVRENNIKKDPSEAYKVWKERVSSFEEEVGSLNKEYDEVGTKKWYIHKRRHLEKAIKKALDDVTKHIEKCPKEILVDKPLERVIKEIDAPSIAEYPTLNNAFQQILSYLREKSPKCVALHGQKWTGKAPIMQHLNNHFYDNSVDNKFDVVIFIKVPADKQKNERIERLYIQEKISERTKVGNESYVDGSIQRVLKNIRYLLILDGVRHVNEILGRLDIPNDERDNKVVIATRFAVKSKYVDKTIKLQRLSTKETWVMFQHFYKNDPSL